MTLCRGDFVPFAEKVMNELFHTDIIMWPWSNIL
jgi:hypothetical protein